MNLFEDFFAGISVKKSFLFILPFLMVSFSEIYAQDEPLTINYRFIIDDGNNSGAQVTIEKDGKKWKNKNGDQVKSFINLDYQHEYIMTFTKKGYVTKRIAISTMVPKDQLKFLADGVEPLEFDVTLFKQYEGVNVVIFNQPVARYAYNEDKRDFIYDTDYTKSILSEMKTAEDQLKQKNKEEKLAAKSNPPPGNGNGSGGSTGAVSDLKKGTESDANPTATGKKSGSESGGNGASAGVSQDDRRKGLPAATENDQRSQLPIQVESDKRKAGKAGMIGDMSNRGGIYGVVGQESRNANKANADKLKDNRVERIYVEGNKKVSEISLTKNGVTIIYKKVSYIWGVFYFKDGINITESTYIQEAL